MISCWDICKILLQVFDVIAFKQVIFSTLTLIEIIRSLVTQEKQKNYLGIRKRRTEKRLSFFFMQLNYTAKTYQK